MARATAAHSTVTFNDTSSCRFLDSGRSARCFAACRSSAARSNVHGDARRARPTARCCAPSHDGYAARFGVIHQRVVSLSADGCALDGEDMLSAGRRRGAVADAQRTNSPSGFTCIRRSRRNRAVRRPRRHAGAARTRRCGPSHAYGRHGRARGKRLSRRPGRPAPHPADRDLRPCPHGRRACTGASATRPPPPPARRAGRADEPELPL